MFPVIFVSLGPGEPELITVKGLKALQTADCIFCPETLAKDGNRVSRAADILLQLDIPENSELRSGASGLPVFFNSTFRKTRCTAFHSP